MPLGDSDHKTKVNAIMRHLVMRAVIQGVILLSQDVLQNVHTSVLALC